MLPRAIIGLLRFLASRKGRTELQPSSIRSIIVVELTRLGDVLVLLPFLDRLQHHFPGARISALVNQKYLAFLNSFESKSEFVGVSRPDLSTGLVRAVSKVRSTHVDLVISASPPRRNTLVALSCKARYKVGYLSHVDSHTPFLETTPVESFGCLLPLQPIYAMESINERPLKILRGLGMKTGSGESHMSLKTVVHDSVRMQMGREGRFPRRRFVLLHPISGWEYRNWPFDNYLQLAESVHVQYGYDVAMSVAAENVDRLRASLQKQPSLPVIISSDLVETAVLTMEAELVVGNDSGPLHLAALLNKKVVGLFGPAHPDLTAPRSENSTFLYEKVECSPCHQRTCVRPAHSCMMLLSPDAVFAAVSRYIRPVAAQPSLTADGQS